ncbi:TIGR00730 family Rossman fold protein [Desulfospira joergensenii]|uniref:LOG family protein n=1 Tax=Desulfospira joergensenii TaxID=53329 RepID=UPI0003B64D0F|nr:TIGR00730 family Rossman fold protein [Desulfospira joergensenii]
MKTLCVYCGSNPGLRPEYGRAAAALAREFLKQGFDLVYGGAGVGIMGIIADTMLAGGGRVIGVMPQALVDKEVSHPGLTELKIVGSMHERKALMAKLSDGFIALPGGLGTLEELLEVLTWTQLGFHRKPCGLLNVLGYYDHLKSFLDLATAEGFIMEAHRPMLIVERDPEQLIQKFMTYEAPRVSKWADRKNPL